MTQDLPPCGQPDVFRHEAGADDGGLLGFDQRHRLLGLLFQQMFSKQALREVPGRRQLPCLAHQGMHPRDAGRDVRVFDAVAGLGIILHDFAGTAAAFDVELEEDGGTVAGDADAVVFGQGLDGARVEEGAKEGDEVGVAVGADGAVDIGDGDGAEGFGFGRDRLWLLRCTVKPGMT